MGGGGLAGTVFTGVHFCTRIGAFMGTVLSKTKLYPKTVLERPFWGAPKRSGTPFWTPFLNLCLDPIMDPIFSPHVGGHFWTPFWTAFLGGNLGNV